MYNKEQSMYIRAIWGTIKRTSGLITVIWYIIIYIITRNLVEHDWYKPCNQNPRMRDNILSSPSLWLQPTTRIYNSKGQVKEGMNGSPEVACTNKGHIRPASPKNVIGHRQSWAVLKYIVVITVSKQLYCRDTLYGNTFCNLYAIAVLKYLEAYIMECLSNTSSILHAVNINRSSVD